MSSDAGASSSGHCVDSLIIVGGRINARGQSAGTIRALVEAAPVAARRPES